MTATNTTGMRKHDYDDEFDDFWEDPEELELVLEKYDEVRGTRQKDIRVCISVYSRRLRLTVHY